MSSGQDRIFRLTDQSISAFSTLRDRTQRQSTILLSVVLLLNIAILLAAVGPEGDLEDAVARLGTRTGIAVASGIAFFLALMQIVLGLERKAADYARAAEKCSEFKLKLRPIDSDETAELEYRVLQASLPSIPERQFARLKIKHSRKVAISRLIDQTPGTPYWLAWIRVTWTGSKVPK